MQSSDFFGVRNARGASALVIKPPEPLASPTQPQVKRRRKSTTQDGSGQEKPRTPRKRKGSSPDIQNAATINHPAPITSEPFDGNYEDSGAGMYDDVPFEALASRPPTKPGVPPGVMGSTESSMPEKPMAAPKQMPDPGMISVFDAEESYA